MDELQKTMRLAVLGTVAGHGGEDNLGMRTQDGKLNIQGGVEHHVGGLLEGQDPFLLGIADVLPLADGLAGGESSFVVITYDAAQQAVILRGNPVVVIERHASEC